MKTNSLKFLVAAIAIATSLAACASENMARNDSTTSTSASGLQQSIRPGGSGGAVD